MYKVIKCGREWSNLSKSSSGFIWFGPLSLRYLIISWYSKNKFLLLKSIIAVTCFNQDVLKSVLFANCCSNLSIFYDNRNESQSEGKVVPCITYNVWATRSLTFRHKNTSYDLLLPTWSVHYLFSLLWIPTKPRWFHRLLDKNPTKQRIIVDIWFRGDLWVNLLHKMKSPQKFLLSCYQ